jgi:hypothetical protein
LLVFFVFALPSKRFCFGASTSVRSIIHSIHPSIHAQKMFLAATQRRFAGRAVTSGKGFAGRWFSAVTIIPTKQALRIVDAGAIGQ